MILLRILFTFLCLQFSLMVGYTASISTTIDSSLETIGTLLNHQDFDTAFRQLNTLDITIAEVQELSYESMLTYVNLIHFSSGSAQ